MDEDDALTHRGRALLATYRAETGPTTEQADRLLGAVRRSAAANDDEAPVVALAGDGSRVRAVVGVGLLAAAALAAFAWLGGQARHDPGGGYDAAVDQARDDAGGGQVIEATPERTTAAPTTAVPTTAAPDDDPRRVEAARGRPASPAHREDAPAEPAPAPDASAGALAGELAFVREVHAILAAGDPARALARVDEYPRLHKAGLLREEVAALRVIAGCGLRSDVEAATAFERAHPRSLLAERVRRACETTNETTNGRTPTARTYP